MRAVWKQQVKRAVSGILAGVMALSLSFAAFPTKALAQGYGKNGTVRDMSSADLVLSLIHIFKTAQTKRAISCRLVLRRVKKRR